MGSPSSVLTLGLGQWGESGLLITSGYGIGEEVVIVSDNILGRSTISPSVSGVVTVLPLIQGKVTTVPGS